MKKSLIIIPPSDTDEEEYDGTMRDISENAFNCLKGDWPAVKNDGTPTKCVENAIAALRWYLEDNRIELKYDVWRKYDVIEPASIIDSDLTIDWLNAIGKEHNLYFSETMFKDAMKRLGRHNKYHSRITYLYRDLPIWDGAPRIEAFVKDCLKAEGTKLELKVMQMHLIASVRKVIAPGTMYQMCICLISPQGRGKSTMLITLYGEDSVLAEDISCADTRTQSERTRQGINCVELRETLGDQKLSVKVRVDRVKSFVDGHVYKGVRDAYGRPENMRPMRRTFVIWHTRNNDKFLEDPTGNRRFLPMPIHGYINHDWLRQNKDQLWAEVKELEERGRSEYYGDHSKDGAEKFPDMFLSEEYWEELADLCAKHMKEGVKLSPSLSYKRLLRDLINQPFIIKTAGQTRAIGDDVRKYLNISEEDWKNTESLKVTKILEELGWEKRQIWIKGQNGGKDEVKQGYRFKGNGD
jgi:hypothetical protein